MLTVSPSAARAEPPANGIYYMEADWFHRLYTNFDGTTKSGAGVTIGQIETGSEADSGLVRDNHPGLKHSGGLVNRDYKGAVKGIIVSGNPPNSGMHATNVAGVMLKMYAPARGVSPKSALVNGRVSAEEADNIRALSDLTGYAVNPVAGGAAGNHDALGLKVVNYSNYNGGDYLPPHEPLPTDGTPLLTRAFDWLITDQNFTLVVIPGNNDEVPPNAMRVPGDAYNAICVAGLDRNGDTFNEIGSYSRRGPTRDGRSKPDLVAPGHKIITTSKNVVEGTDGLTPAPGVTGTSFAAPHVTGAVALLHHMAPINFKDTPATAADALHHLSIKSVLLTGAFKRKTWNRGEEDESDDNDTKIPLSFNYGAGGINVRSAASVMFTGQTGPGEIGAGGFHLGTLPTDAGTFDYKLPKGKLGVRKGNVVIATLAWDRTLDRTPVGAQVPGGPANNPDNDLSNDTFQPHGTRPNDDPLKAPVRNLDLQLIKKPGGVGESMITQSNSPRDNVEHLAYTVKAADVTEQIGLRVVNPGNGVAVGSTPYPANQRYGLSWRVSPNLILARGSDDLAEFNARTVSFGDTDQPEQFSPFGSTPTGLVLANVNVGGGNPSDAFLFAGDLVQNRVRSFDATGTEVTPPTASTVVGPRDLAISKSGHLFVTSDGPGRSDAIVRVNPMTGVSEAIIASGLNNPHGAAFDADGNIWVAEQGAGMFSEFNVSGDRLEGFAAPAGLVPVDLQFDMFGAMWAVCNSSNPGEVAKLFAFDPEGRILFDTALAGITDARSLAINPFDGHVFVSSIDRVLGLTTSGEVVSTLGSEYLIDNGGGLVFTGSELAGQFIPEPACLLIVASVGLALSFGRRRRRG
jgi:hypothetical protein